MMRRNLPKNGPMSRGFNLVEAAIVLGVIGLVIGGIWVTASAISFRQHVSTLSTFVLQAAQTVKGMPSTSSENWTNYLHMQGLTPPTYTYNSDFSGPHIQRLSFDRSGEALQGTFQPEATPTGIALCTQFLMRLVADAESSLQWVNFNDASNNYYLPGNPNWDDLADLEVVQNECNDVAYTGNPMTFELF